MHFEAHTPEEMIALGRILAYRMPQQGAVIVSGELGAGKTTLIKGIAAERAGVDPAVVSSPTFALIHEYGEPPTVYHLDLYRLETDAEVLGLGLIDLLEEDALVLIEWGERFVHLIGAGAAQLTISEIPLSPGTSARRVLYTSPAPSSVAPSSLA